MQATDAHIDLLLAFLPALETPGRNFIAHWDGGERLPNGSLSAAYPVYETDVVAFFDALARTGWLDSDYASNPVREWLDDDGVIATADRETLRSLLTYCLRAERFVDGFWNDALVRGRVQALLRRLAQLRSGA